MTEVNAVRTNKWFHHQTKLNSREIELSMCSRYKLFVVNMQIVRQHSNGRKIYLSSFHPDAVHLLGSMQSTYPVWKQYLHPWFIPSNDPQLLQPFSFLCITVPGLQFSQDSISISVGLCVCRYFSWLLEASTDLMMKEETQYKLLLQFVNKVCYFCSCCFCIFNIWN